MLNYQLAIYHSSNFSTPSYTDEKSLLMRKTEVADIVNNSESMKTVIVNGGQFQITALTHFRPMFPIYTP